VITVVKNQRFITIVIRKLNLKHGVSELTMGYTVKDTAEGLAQPTSGVLSGKKLDDIIITGNVRHLPAANPVVLTSVFLAMRVLRPPGRIYFYGMELR
jgi:hypothetical protein